MQPMGALDDVNVVELSSYISGPYAGTLLADFGAQLIKIERRRQEITFEDIADEATLPKFAVGGQHNPGKRNEPARHADLQQQQIQARAVRP